MKKIPQDFVVKISAEMNGIDDAAASALAQQMRAGQPAVLHYLMGAGGGVFNESERKWFLYLGIAVWRMFSESSPEPLASLDARAFDDKAAGVLELVRYLKGEEEGQAGAAIMKVIETSAQPDVLKYLLYAISVSGPEGKQPRQQTSALMFFFLKILVDCFDQAAPAK